MQRMDFQFARPIRIQVGKKYDEQIWKKNNKRFKMFSLKSSFVQDYLPSLNKLLLVSSSWLGLSTEPLSTLWVAFWSSKQQGAMLITKKGRAIRNQIGSVHAAV